MITQDSSTAPPRGPNIYFWFTTGLEESFLDHSQGSSDVNVANEIGSDNEISLDRNKEKLPQSIGAKRSFKATLHSHQ